MVFPMIDIISKYSHTVPTRYPPGRSTRLISESAPGRSSVNMSTNCAVTTSCDASPNELRSLIEVATAVTLLRPWSAMRDSAIFIMSGETSVSET